MSCEDIPSLLDLQKAKKDVDDLGRLMGTGTGTSTNGNTGQVRPTINKVIADADAEFEYALAGMGYTRIGTFAAGATLTNTRQVLLNEVDGQEYGWTGAFPKVVPAGSTPAGTGGIAVGAWMSRFDPELRIQVREALRRTYAEAGLNLVAGSFEAGGTLTSASDVLLHEASGKAYGWTGAFPKVVAANSSVAGFVDKSKTLVFHANYNTIRQGMLNGVSSVYCIGRSNVFDGGFGFFAVDESDSISDDDDITVLVDVYGRRWKRIYSGDINVLWAGADNTGVLDSTQAFINCILIGPTYAPCGTYKITSIYVPNNSRLSGDGLNTVLRGCGNSGSHTLSVAPRGEVQNISLDGTNSSGLGVLVGNNTCVKNTYISNYYGSTLSEDGFGIVFEGAYSAYCERVFVKNCRGGAAIGKLGTTNENNAIVLQKCKFEYTELAGVLINKANVITFFGCDFGHHGGVNGALANGVAVSIQNQDASVTFDGFYTEHCSVAVINEGKLLNIKNARISSQIKVNRGKVGVSFSEFYGYGAYIDCPSGSTGTALVQNCWSNGTSPIIGPVNFENRVTALNNGPGSLSFSTETGLVSAGPVEVKDSVDGVILKAPNTVRYRVTVNNSGILTVTAI